MDLSPYHAMVDALSFHSSFPNGSQGVYDYMHNLAVAGGKLLSEMFGNTEVIVIGNENNSSEPECAFSHHHL